MHSSSRNGLWGLLVISAVGGLIAFGAYALDQNIATDADGTPAVAHILGAGAGDCMVGNRGSYCFGLRMQVYPTGTLPFVTTVDVLVPLAWSSRVQPGNWVYVVIDRTDPTRVSLNVDAFARAAPAPVASGT